MVSNVKWIKKVNRSFYHCIILLQLLLLLNVITAKVALLSSPTNAVSSGANGLPEAFLLQSSVQRLPILSAITPTPTSSISPTQIPQGQQPSESTIANDTIVVAGVFAAIVGVILAMLTLAAAIATGFGIFELRRIRRFRRLYDNQLKQLDKRIDTASQRLIEATYYFSEGTKEYRAGYNRQAIQNYLEARNYLPTSPRILERIGRAYSNLNENEKAFEYLKLALNLDPDYEPALRSLALYYRYSNVKEAIRLLKQILAKNDLAYESWDFLGLCYRDQLQQGPLLVKDQEIIDKAIEAHERALKIKERPETEFYLGILLFFSPVGSKKRAKDLLISASKRIEEQEHNLRIRGVWKKLIQTGKPIVEDNLVEALKYVQDMIQYQRTQRIYIGAESHLRFLLEGTGHNDWLQAFMDIVTTWKES